MTTNHHYISWPDNISWPLDHHPIRKKPHSIYGPPDGTRLLGRYVWDEDNKKWIFEPYKKKIFDDEIFEIED